MVRDYELMYIARADLDEEGLQAAVESVEQIIDGAGGTVPRSTSWGRRRLAYEVDHMRDGNYMLLHVRLDGGRVADVERALSIHETVFRHLLVLREADEVESEAEPPAAADTADGETPGATAPRQAAVAATPDDAGADEDDDTKDGAPAAALTDDEEDT